MAFFYKYEYTNKYKNIHPCLRVVATPVPASQSNPIQSPNPTNVKHFYKTPHAPLQICLVLSVLTSKFTDQAW